VDATVGSRDDAEAAFREVYADSVVVNGTEMPSQTW
jgi:hypothetical protein